tara:strand:+ start:453 stop:1220 length:768 start_codon:yes stop_codon:yes gene_type:complete
MILEKKMTESIKKEIHALIIGDEILSGKRKDKHLTHLIEALKKNNFQISRADYISDDTEEIKKTLEQKKGVIVFCFGGIGATPDDCTRSAAALAHKKLLSRHPEAKVLIEKQFGKEAYPKRILMADLPEESFVIPNPINNIPGFFINQHFFMPGFPEMAWPMIDWVIENHLSKTEKSKKYEDYSIWLDNVSESSLIDLMNLAQSKYQRIKIYSLPKMHPKKMLELGVRGEEGYVKDALNFIKDNLDKMKISWRNL